MKNSYSIGVHHLIRNQSRSEKTTLGILQLTYYKASKNKKQVTPSAFFTIS